MPKHSKKTILIVARDSYPPFRVDVTQLFSHYLAEYLKINWLMVRDGRGPGGIIHQSDEIFYVIGKGGLLGFGSFIVQHSKALLKIFRKRYDIVQCRDTIILALFYSLAARIVNKPFVYWMSYPMDQGFKFNSALDFGQKRYFAALVRWLFGACGYLSLYWIALPLAKHVFVQSDEMKLDVVCSGIAASKITAVPMGIDLTQFSSNQISSAVDTRYDGHRVILYLGTLDAVRRMDVVGAGVSDYLEQDPMAIFVVIGKHTVQERANLTEFFKEPGILDRLIFIDQLPLNEALGHVKRADVCIASCPADMKLLRVGTPTKLVEYLAMGARVVANHHPDQDEVARNCRSCVMCQFTQQGFKEAIAEAVKLGRLSDEERSTATTWIEMKRSYSTLSESISSIYLDHIVVRPWL